MALSLDKSKKTASKRNSYGARRGFIRQVCGLAGQSYFETPGLGLAFTLAWETDHGRADGWDWRSGWVHGLAEALARDGRVKRSWARRRGFAPWRRDGGRGGSTAWRRPRVGMGGLGWAWPADGDGRL